MIYNFICSSLRAHIFPLSNANPAAFKRDLNRNWRRPHTVIVLFAIGILAERHFLVTWKVQREDLMSFLFFILLTSAEKGATKYCVGGLLNKGLMWNGHNVYVAARMLWPIFKNTRHNDVTSVRRAWRLRVPSRHVSLPQCHCNDGVERLSIVLPSGVELTRPSDTLPHHHHQPVSVHSWT